MFELFKKEQKITVDDSEIIIMKPRISAARRILNLRKQLLDINGNIKEIKFIKNIMNYTFLSINTLQGELFISIYDNKISFSKELGTRFYSFSQSPNYITIEHTDICLVNELFTIQIKLNDKLNLEYIDISPALVNLPMNEEQIFLCILEIEQIINKYKFATNSEEHRINLNKLIERLENK